MDAVTQMVFMIATLILLGALGEYIFNHTGIPDMIWLVATGIVAGPVSNIPPNDTSRTGVRRFYAAV